MIKSRGGDEVINKNRVLCLALMDSRITMLVGVVTEPERETEIFSTLSRSFVLIAWLLSI